MTTYVAIPSTDIDQDSPITQPLMTAVRDNPIAMAEGDASVPATLRGPMQLLGTLTTTSGTAQTLSGLDLTPYKHLHITANGVSFTVAPTTLKLNALPISGASVAAADAWSGTISIDLTTGVATASLSFGTNVAGTSMARLTAYTTAATSIGFTGGTFNAGSIRVYGIR